MSIHTGHRQRLKERFLREGLDNFDELYVLELLLYYPIARKDTNPIAHSLLAHFGSLTAVLEAPVEELVKVPDVGPETAAFLHMMPQLCRYYQVHKEQPGEILHTLDRCGSFLVPYFSGRPYETVYLLCLDAKCKVLCCKYVGEGSVNSANVPIRRLVEIALAANATTVILAHNHPSGLALPSADDIQTTQRVARALNAVEINLADHIVVADGDFVSMVQSGYYRPGTPLD